MSVVLAGLLRTKVERAVFTAESVRSHRVPRAQYPRTIAHQGLLASAAVRGEFGGGVEHLGRVEPSEGGSDKGFEGFHENPVSLVESSPLVGDAAPASSSEALKPAMEAFEANEVSSLVSSARTANHRSAGRPPVG